MSRTKRNEAKGTFVSITYFDPVLTEKDLQLEGILRPLYDALTQYTPTGRWNGAAKLDATGVLMAAIRGDIAALERRLMPANKTVFMGLITKGNLGATIATQLATIATPRNDSKSHKPISIEDWIDFLLKNYRKNHAACLDRELKSQPIFGSEGLLEKINAYLPTENQVQLAISQHSPAFFKNELVKNGLSEVRPDIGEQFLLYVAQGGQDQAEAMLSNNPALAWYSGSVTDRSKRRFTNITAFQYAVWAMDWHMWTMLLTRMPRAEAAKQLQDWDNRTDGRRNGYGQHTSSLDSLIGALKQYNNHYSVWSNANRKLQCSKIIDSALWDLVEHAVNQLCDPLFDLEDRTFTETSLLRMRRGYIRKLDGELFDGEWFPSACAWPPASEHQNVFDHRCPVEQWRDAVRGRIFGLQKLSFVRTEQLKLLRSDLLRCLSDAPADAKIDMQQSESASPQSSCTVC